MAKSLKKMIKQIKSDRTTHQNAGAFFIANIWLQLGWRPPYEVSKNLVDLVPLVLGHGVIQPLQSKQCLQPAFMSLAIYKIP